MFELGQKLDQYQIKKEEKARKPTKIQSLKDDIESVIFDNMQSLVDPNSNGAKTAKALRQLGKINLQLKKGEDRNTLP